MLSRTRRILSSLSALLLASCLAPFALRAVLVERHWLPPTTQVQQLANELCEYVDVKGAACITQRHGFIPVRPGTGCKEMQQQIEENCKAAFRQDSDMAQLDAPHGHLFSIKLIVNDGANMTQRNLGQWNTNVVEPFRLRLEKLMENVQLEIPKMESHVVLMTDLVDVDMVAQSLFRSLSEFDVPSISHEDSPTQRKVVNLVVILTSPNKPSKMVQVPGWGAVVQVSSLRTTMVLTPVWDYIRHVVLGMERGTLDDDVVAIAQAQYKTMARRFARAVQVLVMTRDLAESMPHMRIPENVAMQYQHITYLLESQAGNTTILLPARLKAASEAAFLAEAIAENPDLVSQMYISDENLFAVFSPFILPVAIPLLSSLVSETKAWQVRRRRRRAHVNES